MGERNSAVYDLATLVGSIRRQKEDLDERVTRIVDYLKTLGLDEIRARLIALEAIHPHRYPVCDCVAGPATEEPLDFEFYFPFLFVAAVDASAAEIAIADYVCDGVADEVEINLALAEGRGRVVLSTGTFNITPGSVIGFATTVSILEGVSAVPGELGTGITTLKLERPLTGTVPVGLTFVGVELKNVGIICGGGAGSGAITDYILALGTSNPYFAANRTIATTDVRIVHIGVVGATPIAAHFVGGGTHTRLTSSYGITSAPNLEVWRFPRMTGTRIVTGTGRSIVGKYTTGIWTDTSIHVLAGSSYIVDVHAEVSGVKAVPPYGLFNGLTLQFPVTVPGIFKFQSPEGLSLRDDGTASTRMTIDTGAITMIGSAANQTTIPLVTNPLKTPVWAPNALFDASNRMKANTVPYLPIWDSTSGPLWSNGVSWVGVGVLTLADAQFGFAPEADVSTGFTSFTTP